MAPILRNHSLSSDTQDNFIYRAHKSQHLSSPQGSAWGALATSWLEYGVNTGHILSAISSGKIMHPHFQHLFHKYLFCCDWIYPHMFLSFSFSLTQTHKQSVHVYFTPILPESFPLLCFRQKLQGAAGVSRAHRYQIGHEDYNHTRLNHHQCLLGILSIISLPLWGWELMGNTGPEAEQGAAKHWLSWGWCRLSILSAGLPHWDKQPLPGNCIARHQTSQTHC